MKKILLISLPIAVIALAAIYLFGVPAMQTNGYKTTARSNQLALSASVAKATTTASQNAFSSPESVAEAKNELKMLKDAGNDLETKIKSNEKGLTQFSTLPFVTSVNSTYKKTADLKTLEEKYVKAAKDYLAEYNAIYKYNEQTLPILVIMLEKFPEAFTKLQEAESIDDAYIAIDSVVSQLNEITKIATAIKPAESIKESHEQELKGLAELTKIMKSLKTAMQAMDIDAVTTLQTEFSTKMDKLAKDEDKLNVKFVEESKLTKLGNTLNDLNKQIDLKTAEL